MALRFSRFWRSGKKLREESAQSDRRYYALQEPYGSACDDDEGDDDVVYRSGTTTASPDFDRWDRQLGTATEKFERSKHRWWQRAFWRGRRKRWWAVRIVAAILMMFILMVGWLAWSAPLNKSLEPIAAPQITLLAADGTPIARNGAVTAEPVELEQLPDHVWEPFLAIEDRRFYSHWGIDPRGIARAIWTGYGGGSTITQQLAKFTFLTPERSLSRKGQEMLIAFWLEAWLTKDEILERYLSNAYFGDNVYGLRAASLHYFYRKPENLKPEQAAMLAGLVQAPSRYAPTKHFERAERRRLLVVQSMVAAGYLTEAEAAAMPKPVVDARLKNDLPTGTYFADWALPELRKSVETGYSSTTITTTLDSRLQGYARRAVQRAGLGEAQVALVAMRRDGEVVAMIGGKDYTDSPFNRATQAKRQPGSTFKLFVYLAALREGMEPDDTVDNSEIAAGSYRPKNANGRYSDEMTLEEAFARSSNVAAVRLYNQLGGEAVIETARDFGISSELPLGDPSVALGTSTVTLLELTAAYAGVAANAFPVEPRAVKAEEEGWFDWLWNSQDSLYSSDHEDIEQMLRAAVNRGTGRAAMLRGPNYGKTGTSQGNRDALFVGYAGDLVVGVWVGNDDNSPLDGVTGGGLPARIWRDFMRQALGEADRPDPKPTTNPSGPVQPLDVPDLEDIPIGDDGTRLRVREGEGATLSTEVEGIPVDISLDEDGLRIDPGRREQEPER